MADRSASRGISRDQWAAQIAALDDTRAVSRSRKAPITVGRIVDTAFQLVEAEGFEALTMRRVAAALQTGPSSLYAHVRNKAELDDLLIGELCAKVTLPTPDPAQWKEQVLDVCRQLRDQYLRYPGISRAALAGTPNSLDTLRIGEGLLTILLTGGVSPQSAAWASDAAFLYVSAHSFEASLRQSPGEDGDGKAIDKAEIVERFKMLPESRFPNTVAYARELTHGDEHDRFDFTLELLLRGLTTARS
ncbi:TetR/AcrR family transcriptional regulator [Amycolatopsis sp. NBC_00345]|uniref:TetR/AcrR family transcriptional regulator n=1 Tax=Amycolatopsis sp. NBC_00345 TaxID=2975955 RepID=UPI002E273FB2